jgi:CRP-like cAMP-binding protein
VNIFEPLPEPTLERLATTLREVRVPAGTVVIREGDEGDLFYVVQEGEVEVAGKRLGPGSGFGEIALLRDIPRTATVTAATPVVLQALEREIFLAAVTGHSAARATAEAVATARIGTFAGERLRGRGA